MSDPIRYADEATIALIDELSDVQFRLGQLEELIDARTEPGSSENKAAQDQGIALESRALELRKALGIRRHHTISSPDVEDPAWVPPTRAPGETWDRFEDRLFEDRAIGMQVFCETCGFYRTFLSENSSDVYSDMLEAHDEHLSEMFEIDPFAELPMNSELARAAYRERFGVEPEDELVAKVGA